MRRTNYAQWIGVIGVALVAAGWHSFAAEEKADSGPRATNAKARCELAKAVYEGTWKRHVQQPEQVPFDINDFHDWSVRWMQAERDLSGAKADQVTAIEGHLKRMQSWRDLLVRGVRDGQVATYEASAGEFLVLEAEDWLAAEKAAVK